MVILQICRSENTIHISGGGRSTEWVSGNCVSLVRNWVPSCHKEKEETSLLISVLQESLFQGRNLAQQKWVQEGLQDFWPWRYPLPSKNKTLIILNPSQEFRTQQGYLICYRVSFEQHKHWSSIYKSVKYKQGYEDKEKILLKNTDWLTNSFKYLLSY